MEDYIKLLESENKLLEALIDEQEKDIESLNYKYIELEYTKEEVDYEVSKLRGNLSYTQNYISKLEDKLTYPIASIPINVKDNLYKLLRKEDLEKILVEKLPGILSRETDDYITKDRIVSLTQFSSNKEGVVSEISDATNIALEDIEAQLIQIIKMELKDILLTKNLDKLREFGDFDKFLDKYNSKLLQINLYEREVEKLYSKIDSLDEKITVQIQEKNKNLHDVSVQIIERAVTNLSLEKSKLKLTEVTSELVDTKAKCKHLEALIENSNINKHKQLYLQEITRKNQIDLVHFKNELEEAQLTAIYLEALIENLKFDKLNLSKQLQVEKQTKEVNFKLNESLILKIKDLEAKLESKIVDSSRLEEDLTKTTKKAKKLKEEKKELTSDKFSWVLQGSMILLSLLLITTLVVFKVDLNTYVDGAKDFVTYASLGFDEVKFNNKKMEDNVQDKIDILLASNKYHKETILNMSDVMEGSMLSNIMLNIQTDRDKLDKESYSTIGILGDEDFKWEYYQKGDKLKALKSPYYDNFIQDRELKNYFNEENGNLKNLVKTLKSVDYKLDKTSILTDGMDGFDFLGDSDVKYIINVKGEDAKTFYNNSIGNLLKSENLEAFIQLNKEVILARGFDKTSETIDYTELLKSFLDVKTNALELILHIKNNKLINIEYSFAIETEIDNFTFYFTQTFIETPSLVINENLYLEDSIFLENVHTVDKHATKEDSVELIGKVVDPKELNLQGE